MARLRIRLKLNPGREGIAMGKLSQQLANVEAFLRSLASDLGVDDSPNSWLASKFANGSVFTTSEYQAVVDVVVAEDFNRSILALSNTRSGIAAVPAFVSSATVERFSNLRQSLDADERIGLGIYQSDDSKVSWTFVNRVQLEEIARSIDTETIYIGSIIGRTHEWNKGADKPYLIVREISKGELVKCSYNDRDYNKVARLFNNKSAIVVIQGRISFNRITSKSEMTGAEQFDFAPEFSDEDFINFFGCAPDFSGSLSPAEFIKNGRSHEH